MITAVEDLTCSFLTQDGNVYNNVAYGTPEVTVTVDMESSIVEI